MFKANFVPKDSAEEDLGASFVVYKDGKEIVSLTAGWCDPEKVCSFTRRLRPFATAPTQPSTISSILQTKPYTEDTLQIIHSAGKTVMAMNMAHIISQGLVDYDQKIAHYWPEFAQGGKQDVLVKDLLMHCGGVQSLNPELVPNNEEMHDLDKLAAKIAKQPHNNGGKLTKSYHAITRGWYRG